MHYQLVYNLLNTISTTMITHSELDYRLEQIKILLQRVYKFKYSEDYEDNIYKQNQVKKCYAKIRSHYYQLHKLLDN